MTEIYTSDVKEALERRFNPPSKARQWATFTEVSDGAQRRRVDFLAVNLWLSAGREIQGMEIKVSRSDWLKELRQPKADAWYSVANRWWLAAPQGVLQPGELPKTWGFLEMRHGKNGLRAFEKVPAPHMQPAEEWPNWLVMRLLSRIEDVRKATPEAIVAARDEGYGDGLARGQQNAAYMRAADPDARLRGEFDDLLAVIGLGDDWRTHHLRLQIVKQAVLMANTGPLDQKVRSTRDALRLAVEALNAVLPPSEGGSRY